MSSEDNPNIIRRFLNWFFPKKLYDPFDKRSSEKKELEKSLKPETIYIKKNNNSSSEKKELEERLEKLKMIIKKNKSFESSDDDEIDLS